MAPTASFPPQVPDEFLGICPSAAERPMLLQAFDFALPGTRLMFFVEEGELHFAHYVSRHER